MRPPDDPPMGALISCQIARRERLGQGGCLAKCHGEAFAGYRIDGTGGVADEDNAVLSDRAQPGRLRDRPPQRSDRLAVA